MVLDLGYSNTKAAWAGGDGKGEELWLPPMAAVLQKHPVGGREAALPEPLHDFKQPVFLS